MSKPTPDNFEGQILGSLLTNRLGKIYDNNRIRGYDVSLFVRCKEEKHLPEKKIKEEPDIEPGESLWKKEPDDYWDDNRIRDIQGSTVGSNSSSGLEILRHLLSSKKVSVGTLEQKPTNPILKLEPGESIYQPVKLEPEEIILSDDDETDIAIENNGNSANSECARENFSPILANTESSSTNINEVQESHDHSICDGVVAFSEDNNREQPGEISPVNTASDVGNATNNHRVASTSRLAIIRACTRKIPATTQKANKTTARGITRTQKRGTDVSLSNLIYSRSIINTAFGQTIPKSTIIVIKGIPFAAEDKNPFSMGRVGPGNAEPYRKTCKKCGDSVFLDFNHFVDHLRHHSYSKMYCLVCQKGSSGPVYAENHVDIHVKNHVECTECFRFFPNAETLKTHKMEHKGKPPFRCEHCPMKLFLTFRQLKNHIRNCHITNLTCDKCGSNFQNEKELETHLCSAGKVFECPKCSEDFEIEADMESHVKGHLEYVRLIYLCKICNSLFNSYNELIVHRVCHILEYDPNVTSFMCQLCKKDFKNVEGLTKHVRRHSRKRYHCSVCQTGFTRQKHVIRHLKVHENNYSRCPQCFNFYKDPRDLKNHERIHRMGPPFYCENCPKEEFVSFVQLYRHINRTHSTLKCDICNKKFKKKHQLTVHRSIHTKKYPCKLCDKKFGRTDYLRKHMTMHKKTRAFKCPVCKHKFSRSDNFKAHVKKMHKGDKTYECPCGMKFEHALLYNMHKAHHRSLVLFCDFCHEKFKKFKEIKKHIMIEHLKFTKYTCDVCKEDFLKNENLILHYDKKHKSIHSICDVCGLGFDSYTKLKDHKDAHEMENKPPVRIIIKVPKEGNKRKSTKYSSYDCHHCGIVFHAMRILKHHILTEHFNAENYECNLCGDGFLNVKTLHYHYYKSHRDENVICDICGSHFTKYGDFIKHKNKHEKDKIHQCDKCRRSFLTAAELKRHRLNTHQKAL